MAAVSCLGAALLRSHAQTFNAGGREVQLCCSITPGLAHSHKHSKRRQLTRVEPEYPQQLRPVGIKGTVYLRLTISPQGRVGSAAVLGGDLVFGDAAVNAARQWIYVPAATTSTIDVAIPFDPNR